MAFELLRLVLQSLVNRCLCLSDEHQSFFSFNSLPCMRFTCVTIPVVEAIFFKNFPYFHNHWPGGTSQEQLLQPDSLLDFLGGKEKENKKQKETTGKRTNFPAIFLQDPTMHCAQ